MCACVRACGRVHVRVCVCVLKCLPPPRPDKNYVLFTTDWEVTYDARQVCEGEVGDLPLLLGVSCGYDPDDADSYMRIYETDEVSEGKGAFGCWAGGALLRGLRGEEASRGLRGEEASRGLRGEEASRGLRGEEACRD